MYAQFFGLKQEPFSIAPDPRYLFMSERHREALAHLLYGVGHGGGFVLLSGEIGAGKTTVCRCFLEQIPRRCNVAYIFNPKLTVGELLKSVCDEFHIPHHHDGPGVETVKDYLDPLNEYLLRTHAVGQNNVLIIDEAQNLSADVLEQLRLLTNLETNERKLLQIVLIGQPELRAMLARPELEQLAQRVIARFHLEALSEVETAQYVRHRLTVAGLKASLPFDRQSLRRVHQLSRGVPRRINLLCDRALLGAYAAGKNVVDRHIVDKAAAEVFDTPVPLLPARPPRRAGRWRHSRLRWATGLGVLAGATLFGVVTLAMVGGLHRPRPGAIPGKEVAMAPAPSAVSASVNANTTGTLVPRPVAAVSVQTASDLKTGFKSPIREENEAWRELAQSSWNVALGDGDACTLVQASQLQCFRSSSGLALIRQLARPVILTLYDQNGRAVYALLTGLSGQSATLRMGGVPLTVSLPALATMWRGEFATLWRAPPGYRHKIVGGNVGEAVDWVAARLADLYGQPAPSGKQVFDSALQAKVHAFQLTDGLKPDGLAGPLTLMQINRAAGVDEPRLRSDPAAH